MIPAKFTDDTDHREHFHFGTGWQDDVREVRIAGVQPSKLHNNDKAGDDVYLLAHICINAAAGDNLAKKIFLRSIQPNLSSPVFKAAIAKGARAQPNGAVDYPVDVARFDSFFTHLRRLRTQCLDGWRAARSARNPR